MEVLLLSVWVWRRYGIVHGIIKIVLVLFFAVLNHRSIVVRTCVLEDMNSQCGTFKFENDTLKGCLLTCDFDGCNSQDRIVVVPGFTYLMTIVVVVLATNKLYY